MFKRHIDNQHGLALLGSLLLVSTLAVLSTAFLLVMAADVRISQSHHRNTQAYYFAESAASTVAYKLSNDPSLTSLSWSSGLDSFIITISQPGGYPSYKRLAWIKGFSDKASIDIYQDVLLPSQDPRTYYAIVAGSKLELRDWCGVEGGGGVWMSGVGRDAYIPPYINDDFQFESPSVSDPLLLVGRYIEWGTSDINPVWDGVLDIRGGPVPDDIVPQVLLSDSSPYPYKVTGDATVYEAGTLPLNLSGGYRGPTGSFGTAGDNPMGIWVWDHSSDGRYSGNFTMDGTLYCPNTTSRLEFDDGNVTITPVTYTAPDPDERYPAIVSKGEIRIRGWGTRDFNGLVYCGYYFDSDPSSNWCYVDGMLIADKVRLRDRTTVRYRSYIQTQPAAPFAGGVYPTVVLHQRRYMYSPF